MPSPDKREACISSLTKVVSASKKVAAFDWGTSVSESYHFDRISAMHQLRASLSDLKPALDAYYEESCNERTD